MNLHKKYYRDYFGGLNYQTISADQNIQSIHRRIEATLPQEKIDNEAATHKFSAKVEYPGLVTGVGINHEATIEGEFKLGVHFDWTRGIPVVYGSSVKGVLRAYFKEFYQPKSGQPSAVALIDDIFEGKTGNDYKSTYKRDIFFDAVVTRGDRQNHILASDAITQMVCAGNDFFGKLIELFLVVNF